VDIQLRNPAALVQHWFRRRQGPDGDNVELHQRRIYILPTRTGLGFGLVLFTMLLGALNYSNNMGFALAFLLTSITVVSIHHTQRNLAGLRVTVEGCTAVFAGELIECGVRIANQGRSARWQIEAGPAGAATLPADLPAGGSAVLRLCLPTTRRGTQACPVIRLSTRYPFGLFEAWAWVYPERELMVYPTPAARLASALPAHAADLEHDGDHLRGSDEFAGLRVPLPGESPARMAWKALARSGQLLAKDFRSGAGSSWFDWDALGPQDTETRLSLLTRMILDANAAGRAYGLRLPGIELPPDTGIEHYHRCLRTLAVYVPEAAATGGAGKP
jgi:uncharacterized protein (DUF58 family)